MEISIGQRKTNGTKVDITVADLTNGNFLAVVYIDNDEDTKLITIEEDGVTTVGSLNPYSIYLFAYAELPDASKQAGIDLLAAVVAAGSFQSNSIGYCTVDDVLAYTQNTPADLGVDTDNDLAELLQSWITKATGIIDEYCGQSWQAVGTVIPSSISMACWLMVANLAMDIVQAQKSPIIKINEYSVKQIRTKMLTKDVTDLLDLYKVGKGYTQASSSPQLALATLTYADVEAAEDD